MTFRLRIECTTTVLHRQKASCSITDNRSFLKQKLQKIPSHVTIDKNPPLLYEPAIRTSETIRSRKICAAQSRSRCTLSRIAEIYLHCIWWLRRDWSFRLSRPNAGRTRSGNGTSKSCPATGRNCIDGLALSIRESFIKIARTRI
jgi:hypothetical protein